MYGYYLHIKLELSLIYTSDYTLLNYADVLQHSLECKMCVMTFRIQLVYKEFVEKHQRKTTGIFAFFLITDFRDHNSCDLNQ